MSTAQHSPLLTSLVLCTCFALSACGESVINEGGGAGDSDNTTDGAALILPFVGIYNLDDGWSGTSGDRAFLSIRQPGVDNTAEAVLFDVDDIDNCIPQRNTSGVVRKDLFSDRIFLDDIPDFDQSELSIAGNSLTIEFVDSADIDNDGSNEDLVQISATRVSMMETDLGDPC